MSREEIRDVVLSCLAAIAPEADLSRLRPDVSIRDELDIDSVDFLNFVIALHESLHVDIAETDYAKIATLEKCIAYLATHLA
jgi:acyl carrier protein